MPFHLLRYSKLYRWGSLLLFWFTLTFPSLSFATYMQLDGIADIKTNFSNGCASIKDIAKQSERLGIDAVIFGDYARNSIEFGPKPFERIFKNKTEGPSILGRGASGFISEIKDNDRQIKETILIPGVETSPFYYWSGSNYDGNLTAHNWDKHLLIVGLSNAPEYEQLPLQNSNFSLNYTDSLLQQFIIIGFLFMLSVVSVYKGYVRAFTVPLMVLFLLMIFNNHPFQSSPFDAYHGDQGMKPYQNMIDYANSKGAMVFWNHMESNSGIRRHGTIKLKTLPYPEDLLKTKNYTGFQVIGDHQIQQIEAGQQWDQVLMEYLRGQRQQPVWGYGGNNHLCENQNDNKLGSVRTVFLVREKKRGTLLDAMRKGRMYAVRQNAGNRLSLDEFFIEDQKTGRQATLGQELTLTDFPTLKIKLRSIKGENNTAQIQIIRNGILVKQETMSLPYKLTWRDLSNKQGERAYYRIKVSINSIEHLVSNPIFVKFSDSSNEVAPLPPFTQKPTPTPPIIKSAAPPNSMLVDPKKFLKVIVDGAALRKGPGTVFPQIAKLGEGVELEFIRRTNIEFNNKSWLVVKRGNRSAYIWEGVVQWVKTQPANMETK